jgi:hypothetical protein
LPVELRRFTVRAKFCIKRETALAAIEPAIMEEMLG